MPIYRNKETGHEVEVMSGTRLPKVYEKIDKKSATKSGNKPNAGNDKPDETKDAKTDKAQAKPKTSNAKGKGVNAKDKTKDGTDGAKSDETKE